MRERAQQRLLKNGEKSQPRESIGNRKKNNRKKGAQRTSDQNKQPKKNCA